MAKRKRLPFPSPSLSAQIFPPCNSTNCRVKDNPIPFPETAAGGVVGLLEGGKDPLQVLGLHSDTRIPDGNAPPILR